MNLLDIITIIYIVVCILVSLFAHTYYKVTGEILFGNQNLSNADREHAILTLLVSLIWPVFLPIIVLFLFSYIFDYICEFVASLVVSFKNEQEENHD